MNRKSLKTLEFDKIIRLLEEHATSRPGQKLCTGLTPSDDADQIALRLTQTDDATARLLRTPGRPSFGNNKDFSAQLSRLAIGASLRAGELLELASLLENTDRIRRFGIPDPGSEEAPDSLTDFFEELAPLPEISRDIRRYILSEDEIADDATPALRDLRKKKTTLEGRIHTQLTSMVNGSARTYLQDPVVTLKNGRYCLPVKSEHKGNVPGIVHERSGSGFTLFIEPSAIVDLNNKIREIEQEEKEEIERFLQMISARLSEYEPQLKRNSELMTILDFIFAKAGLALTQKASKPEIAPDNIVSIKKGRHPLLDPSKVVPVDITLSSDTRQMIITGPNTGGKTVTLKTLGLFSLMAQSGLFIPASDHSSLPVYRNVYADIGDEQSIEQSLSTFSSHMTNIVSILKEADAGSLCLFDELCSGTDPDEGAALAISILETLRVRRSMTAATTHYSELKLYALSTPGVINACCEFDLASLMPTYRLLLGVPGKSNAFAISEKLGLSKRIIEDAGKRISKEQESFEDVIASLESARISMEQNELSMAEKNRDLEQRLAALEKAEAALEEKKGRLLEEANEEARQILMDAKKEADETIRALRRGAADADLSDLERERTHLREKIQERSSRLSLKKQTGTRSAARELTAESVKIGDSVKILSMNTEGVITCLPDHKGKVSVRCGSMNMAVKLSDLAFAAPSEEEKPIRERSSFSKMAMNKSRNVGTELNLLGKTVDEAMTELDKYLDDAYMAHIPIVRIVHGKGTGALRGAVHSYLKRQKHVKEYRLGEFGEGDAGVTIVTFK